MLIWNDILKNIDISLSFNRFKSREKPGHGLCIDSWSFCVDKYVSTVVSS